MITDILAQAADVVVVPYPVESVLSSGTLLTSLSFGA